MMEERKEGMKAASSIAAASKSFASSSARLLQDMTLDNGDVVAGRDAAAAWLTR
jgi:hypothetical protein